MRDDVFRCDPDQEKQNQMLWSGSKRAECKQVEELLWKEGNPIIVTDEHERVVGVSASWLELCGYDAQKVWGQTPKDLLHGPHTDRQAARDFSTHIRTGHGRVVILNYRKNGTPFRNTLRGIRFGDLLVAQTIHAENFPPDLKQKIDRDTQYNL